ncbi:Maf-like protein [Gottschalkia purinilytica]|uniref:dTTP/UTP pyrophosphatase n=1 Tax=Gottschalkia purinilytica TaxID=1503 RepID=A0A0L0WDC5_GOTPU|nr:Maf family protein [Gottschalkia purinilytica]KNF09463.1 Maf-like protein [Gottschalkia purinilytica]
MKSIVLASGSPRRKELLRKFNLEFNIIPSDIKEYINDDEGPIETAMSLALQKVLDVSNKQDENKIILALDTIVYKDSILGKPKDRDDAFNMLNSLNGKEHYVITGIAIVNKTNNVKLVDYESTKVKFRELSTDKIERYLDTEEYKDKAGAYGIQGYGEILVEWIKGSYSNVVGLPISKIDNILEKFYNIKLL